MTFLLDKEIQKKQTSFFHLYLHIRKCSHLSSYAIRGRKMLSSIASSLREALARSKPFNIGGLGEMLRHNWYLGFTAFGGPAVHFQIVCTHSLGCVHAGRNWHIRLLTVATVS